jgi:hypothetical protein
MNGGTKIMPLYGNVNNTTFKVSAPFVAGASSAEQLGVECWSTARSHLSFLRKEKKVSQLLNIQ